MFSFTDLIPFSAAGLAAGLIAYKAFQLMPDSWLLDYDETEIPAGFAERRALPLLPQGLFLIILTGLLYALIPQISNGWQRAAAMLAIPILLLILVSDWKTRIIPDQLTLALVLPALIKIVGEGLAGTPWPVAFGKPVLAGIVAGGSLLLIGLIGQLLLRRDAMGMGDVKMIAVAGLLVGWGRLPHLLLLAFLTAAVIAVPLLIRNKLAERRIEKTDAPEQLSCADIDGETDLIEPSESVRADYPDSDADPDPVDDPNAMAFGPFIAISVLILMLCPGLIDKLIQAYLGLILR